MAKGRKPLPENLHVLHGNPGKRKREAKATSVKPKRVPTPPRSFDKEEKKAWRKVGRILLEMNLLENADIIALELLTKTWVRWEHANDQISQYGLVVKTPNGMPVQSPYLQISNKCLEQMNKLLVEFGMTPSARSRISAPKTPAGS